MKTAIVENQHYTLEVDPEENLLHLSVVGTWENESEVKGYPADVAKACDRLSPGFIVIADLRKMGLQNEYAKGLHLQAQDILRKKGIMKSIEIEKSAFVKFQAYSIAKMSEMPVVSVQSEERALSLVQELKQLDKEKP